MPKHCAHTHPLIFVVSCGLTSAHSGAQREAALQQRLDACAHELDEARARVAELEDTQINLRLEIEVRRCARSLADTFDGQSLNKTQFVSSIK